MSKRLYRSRTSRMIWGVCGGLAQYFDVDPVIVRIIFVLLFIANGLGLLAYIILAIVVPLEGSRAAEPGETIKENVSEMKESAAELGREIRSTFGGEGAKREVAVARPHSGARTLLGIFLILLGVTFLIGNFLPWFGWFGWSHLWPVILVAVGLLIIFATRRRK